MLEAAALITRLAACVDGFRSVQGAGELAALMDARVPMGAGKPFAHVVSTGLRGSDPQTSAGAFTQMIDVTFSVFLTFPTANDPTGSKLQSESYKLINATIGCLAGWAPDDCVGVFRLVRGGLQSLKPGAAVYIIDFAVLDQVRIYA